MYVGHPGRGPHHVVLYAGGGVVVRVGVVHWSHTEIKPQVNLTNYLKNPVSENPLNKCKKSTELNHKFGVILESLGGVIPA